MNCSWVGHQRGAVLQRPAVILDVGDLEPLGAELDREDR